MWISRGFPAELRKIHPFGAVYPYVQPPKGRLACFLSSSGLGLAVGILLQINARLRSIEANGGVESETAKIAALADVYRVRVIK